MCRSHLPRFVPPLAATLAALLAALLALSCARSGAAPPSPAPGVAPPAYEVRDLMPSFWAFWDEDRPAAGGDTAALVRLFRERVVRPESAFFARAAGGPTDDQIRSYLGRVGADVRDMRKVSARLGRTLPRYAGSFARTFPDFAFDGTIFFYPSLYIRDGGTMSYPPGIALMFGVDVIARLHGPDADLKVLFDHELFHLYHAQQHPGRRGPAPLYRRIWGEGLATYVSQRLNPHATELQVLLNDRRLLEARARLPALAAGVLEHLDDTSSARARPYLQGGTDDPDVPPRAGYLIGLRAAQLIGARRSPRELAQLPDSAVRREMARALHVIARTSGRPIARERGPDPIRPQDVSGRGRPPE